MATSGNTSYDLTRNDIIEAAYRKLGLPGEGNTLTATQYTDGLSALNAVVALAVTDGMPLWKRTQTALTPSASSQVYTIADAVKVANVSIRTTSGGTQYDLEHKSLYDFNRLPYGQTGVPVSWTWQPTLTGVTLSIYPSYSDSATVSGRTLQVVYQKEFDGFDATTTDTMDFPPYWGLALIYQTAVVLAPESGVPLEDRKALAGEAGQYWKIASSYGDEDGSIFIQPTTRY